MSFESSNFSCNIFIRYLKQQSDKITFRRKQHENFYVLEQFKLIKDSI